MDKKHRQRRTQQHITECFSNIKNPDLEDLGREGLLFADGNSQYKPEYLELPIEIERDLGSYRITHKKLNNLPESSISSSEQMDNKVIEENSEQIGNKQSGDEDLDELMNIHN